jgi:hypothetical protein
MNSFVRSELTTALANHLATHDKGTEISYDQLSQVAGETITSRSSHLRSAMRIVLNEHDAVWACIRNVGIKRLTDQEIAKRFGFRFLRGASNKLRRGRTEIDAVDHQGLTLREQAEVAVRVLSAKTRRKLERLSRGIKNDFPSFNIVDLATTLTKLSTAKH